MRFVSGALRLVTTNGESETHKNPRENKKDREREREKKGGRGQVDSKTTSKNTFGLVTGT